MKNWLTKQQPAPDEFTQHPASRAFVQYIHENHANSCTVLPVIDILRVPIGLIIFHSLFCNCSVFVVPFSSGVSLILFYFYIYLVCTLLMAYPFLG